MSGKVHGRTSVVDKEEIHQRAGQQKNLRYQIAFKMKISHELTTN